ncbi:hypothetical protein AWB77_06695 [Caballeronia fortuita]|uniref:Uncharacterized protein n=1 Tax=Caballeronia fortuita TaxID=1777138 RepID=A0A158EAX3_9BURK|nr:hypothetical protein [Caballeronia fortuita]SAL03057.1 hypothetical protein AWB77_06695 [Caballeronia fortuita]
MKFEQGDRVVAKVSPVAGRQGTVLNVKGSSIVVMLDGNESEMSRTWHLHESDIDLVVMVEAVKLPDEFDATATALGITREAVQQDMAKVFDIRDDAVILDAPGYQSLARVLARAFAQAAHGKGKERHAQDGEPFDSQVMQEGAKRFGVGALLFQAFKKSEESQRLQHDAAIRELLGSIVYLAGAVIAMERAHHA